MHFAPIHSEADGLGSQEKFKATIGDLGKLSDLGDTMSNSMSVGFLDGFPEKASAESNQQK